MEENWNKLDENPSFVTFLTGDEAEIARVKALEAYIAQLEQRIGVTDPELHPRYLNRLNNELNMAKSELKSVTES